MEKVSITWRIFCMYLLVLVFILISGNAFSQIKVIQFNAGWNKANEATWVMKLTDCQTIMTTQEDVNEIKVTLEKIEDKLYK